MYLFIYLFIVYIYTYNYMHCIHGHVHFYMAVDQNPVLSRPPLPLLQAFVAAGCFELFVADFPRL